MKQSHVYKAFLFFLNWTIILLCACTDTFLDKEPLTIDVNRLVVRSATSLSMSEGGASSAYNLSLKAAPRNNVTLTLSTTGGEIQLNSAASVTLTFTPTNWSTAQVVTVSIVDDADVEGDHSATIFHTVASDDPIFDDVPDFSTTVNVEDNDANIIVSQSGGTTNVSEAGATDTYSFILEAPPTDTVTITITAPANLRVNGATSTTVVFNSGNWNVAQSVTVSANDDAIVEGDHSANLSHSVSSTDPIYATVIVADITVNIADNDSAGVSIVQSGGTTNISEAGTTDTYTIVLSSEPTSNVTITVTADAQVRVGGTSSQTLTFTPANWNTAQTITVSAADDSDPESQHIGTVSHSAGSADGNYNGISIGNVVATIADNDPGWFHKAYLKAANAEADDQFGTAVDVDGDTVVVGASLEDSSQTTVTNGPMASSDNTAANSGAVYVFLRSGSNWSQQAYLKAPNADASDYFGNRVAIDGNTIVVGARYESSNQTFITNGTSASADNSTLNSGAAYVFVRSGSTWSQQAYLKAPNPGVLDNFGVSVSIDADTIVVGAMNEDSNQTTITNGSTASSDNSLGSSGAAYVFTRSGTTWTQQAYLKAPNANANDLFGNSVAIDGNTIVVGARWEESNQTSITNGTTASPNNLADRSGAAYVFTRTGSNWSQQAYLKASNAATFDWFGTAVSISGNTIVASAYGEDSNQSSVINGSSASSNNSMSQSGAAYLFTRTGSNWSQQAYLKAPNVEADDRFGYNSISINGNIVVVGAVREDSSQTTITNGETASADNSATNAGAAYVFIYE